MQGPRLVILQYHSVRNDGDCCSPLNRLAHQASVFRWQMEQVSASCDPISIEDVPDMLTGVRPMSRRAVAITFDDGFRDNFMVAAPIHGWTSSCR